MSTTTASSTVETATMPQDAAHSPWLFAIYSAELLLHTLEIPASILNFILILRSQVIHPNMKYILLYQSGCFLTRGFSRSYICIGKYASGNAIFEERLAQFVYLFAVSSRNFLAHILTLERIMATLWVRNYEQQRGWAFTAIWMPIAILASAFNVYSVQIKMTTLPAFIMSLVMLILAILEIIIFLWLLFYNEKMYELQFRRRIFSNLSIRYQVTENIRIGKQLIPTLIFHLWTLLTSFTVWMSASFTIGNISYILAFATSTNTFCSLMIEITTITRHPFLKRDLINLLNGIPLVRQWMRHNNGRNNRIVAAHHHQLDPQEEDGATTTSENGENGKEEAKADQAIAMRDLNGRTFDVQTMNTTTNNNPQEEYFKMLSKFWENKY